VQKMFFREGKSAAEGLQGIYISKQVKSVRQAGKKQQQ
jgi:hypothetical protein